MSIARITELVDGRTGSADVDGRYYKRVFNVECTSATDGPYTVLWTNVPELGGVGDTPSGAHVPRYGEVHPQDPYAGVVGMDAGPAGDDSQVFVVGIEYSTSGKPSEFFNPERPELIPSDKAWGQVQTSEIMYEDNSDPPKPVLNTVGEPILLMRDFMRPTFTVNRIQTEFDPERARLLTDTLNADLFYGAPIGWAKMANITAKNHWVAGTSGGEFWRVSYVVHFKENGWDVRLLNQGYRQKVTIPILGDLYFLIKDPDSDIPIQQPVPLSAQGQPLPPGDTNYHWLDFKKHPSADWIGLNL